jgi:FkbM family methyltransferase
MMSILKRLFWHVRNEQHLLRWIVSRCLFYTGAGQLLTINCGLYRIRFFPSAVSLVKWLNPSFGADDEKFLCKILRPNDTVIDVGANIGTISLACASLVGEKGRVIAFEPNPRTFGFLKKNIRLNNFTNITPHNCAVGDKKGVVCFSDQKHDDQNRITSEGRHNVSLITLDEQLSSIKGRIRLLKVDVEGYEKFVFLGALKTLERTDYICCEVFEPHFAAVGYKTSDLLRILKDSGFCLYRIDEGCKYIAIDTDYMPERCMNIVGKREGI